MKQASLIEKAFLLKKSSLFGNQKLDLLLPISEKMHSVMLRANEKIFSSGQEAHHMYLIIEGEVDIYLNRGKALARLSSNDFFGDEAIFGDQSRKYEAISVSDTQLLSLSKTNFLSIVAEIPSVALELLRCYASKLQFRER